jgi:methionyl-tRNA formyltransferase
MRALFITSGRLIAAKVLHAWLATGNSAAALWIGSQNRRRFMQRDRWLGIAAPSWSISAMVRRYQIPLQRNPRLATWPKAAAAIQHINADVLITAMTFEIVPENILSLFPGRAVNFHPAILPHYRGPNPRTGMILDGTAELYGGITLHCLSRGIDKGDVIGVRKVPYEASRGFIHWDVSLARAAADLTQNELQHYLGGALTPCSQPAGAGSYRKVRATELTLSQRHSASHTKWLCDQLEGWIRFRSRNGTRYAVSHFVRRLGPRTRQKEHISKFNIEFDAADARVNVARIRPWSRMVWGFRRWLAIVQARPCPV